MSFDGETYDPALDAERLTSQLERVRSLMRDGSWRTLAEISSHCRCTTQSASARLRDFRKHRFGSCTIERRRVSGGLFEYRLVMPIRPNMQDAVQQQMDLEVTA